MTDIAVLANTDAVADLWRGICWLCRWLFVDECTTATTLLSMSFSINTIFTGLSLTRFNLSLRINNEAMRSIHKTINDKFLEKLERLSKDNKDICFQLHKFSQKEDRYRRSMESEPIRWDNIRRGTTIVCAIIAFILVVFEIKSRVGAVLVLPYVIFLLCHAILVKIRTHSLIKSFEALNKAMDMAERKPEEEFNIDDCINNLRKNHQALAPCSKKGKVSPSRKKEK